MSAPTLVLNQKQWSTFCKTLKGLGRQCNDVDIREGIIRQCSTNRATLFEIDLRPIIGNSTFIISYFKEKLKSLRIFQDGVTITLGEKEHIYSDGVSDQGIMVPDGNYLDNKFLSQEEFNSLFPPGYEQAPALIRNRIKRELVKRTRGILSKFNATNYRVYFQDQCASISIEKKIKRPFKKEPVPPMYSISEIPLFIPLTGHTLLAPSPYKSFDFEEDMSWEVYKVGRKLFSKHCGSIGDITAIIYTQGELMSFEPEPPPVQKK